MAFTEIEIGGKTRAFRYGAWNIGEIQEYFDLDIVGLGMKWIKNPLRTVPVIMYYGHKFECERRDEPIDFTIQDFAQWIEDFDNTYAHPEIDKVLQCMTKAASSLFPKATEGKAEKKSTIKKVG